MPSDSKSPLVNTLAASFGVLPAERASYFGIWDGKMNMSGRSSAPTWIHIESQAIGNGDAEYPYGDSVGVVSRWFPRSPFAEISWPDLIAILERLNRGLDDGDRYAVARQAGARWAGSVFTPYGCGETVAKRCLKAWIDEGVLRIDSVVSKHAKKPGDGVFVDPGKLAEMRQSAGFTSPENAGF